ncbi:ATPase [Altererythrobacter sp. HHU K3-1]|uniref:ATPase n=1 Tax=Qipengyuania atrilutea TaxID=2744473 RepID=A0A850H970_9SPHN|nr:ATPase [Actirhodobacter atriluteus]
MALPLGSASPSDPARIIVGPANKTVIDALGAPDDWPFRTAVLTGPPRSGKSLLGRWFSVSHPSARVIDDAHEYPDTDLFHAWNRAQQASAPLLLIANREGPDAETANESADLFGGSEGWTIALPDLRSRLGAALHLEIAAPDEEMLAALIESHAARRGLALPNGALTYLVPRIERSHAAAEQVVAEIDRLSLERKAPPTLSIWRAALEAVQGPEQGELL